MKRTIITFILISLFFVLPNVVSAEAQALPKAENGVITLTEDVKLSSVLTINEDTVINLNNHQLTLLGADNKIYADVEIKNGTLDVSGVTVAGDAIIGLGNYSNKTGTLSLNNVTFKGNNYSSAYAVVYLYGKSTLNINDSVLVFNTDKSSAGGVIKAKDGLLGKVNITNSELTFIDTVRGFLDGTVLIKDSDVTIRGIASNGLDNAFNTTSGGLSLTFDNSNISVSGATGRAITLDNTTLTVRNNTVITASDCDEGDILAKTSGVINADSTSTINASVLLRSDAAGTIEITGGKYSTDVTRFIKNGYIYKMIGNLYVVSKEYNVVVQNNIGGTLTVSKQSAFVGDVITISATANEGYYLKAIEVKDKNGNIITVNNNTFVMPENEVVIKALFNEFEKTVEAPTIDTTKEVDEITVGITSFLELKNILLEELAKTNIDTSNKNVAVVVEIGNLTPKDEVKNAFEEKINEEKPNLTITDYFDINLIVKNIDTGETLDTLNELSNKIKLKVLLPKELQNTNSNYERKYYVIRQHGDLIEVLDAKLEEDGKTLSFESEKFSTYALAYEDVEITNPGTSDNVLANIILAMISFGGLIGGALFLKRS